MNKESYYIKERFINTNKEKVLDFTESKTMEECFWCFVEGVNETHLDELKREYNEYLDEKIREKIRDKELRNKNLKSIEDFRLMGNNESNIYCKRLFDIWNGGDESRIFGYNDEPDWNEMLEYRYGNICTPVTALAKYYIVKL